MSEIEARTFQRKDSAATWESVNPILGDGEIGVDTTNNQFRVGDGTRRWKSLPPVGVTARQVEGLVTTYLDANPPVVAGNDGLVVTVGRHPTIRGAGILTIGSSAGSVSITINPSDLLLHVGDPGVLSAAANPSSAAAQWQVSPDGGATWGNIQGAILRSYRPSTDAPSAAISYRALFTQGAAKAFTQSAKVTVFENWVYTLQPQSQNLTGSGNVSFFSNGTGTGFTRSWEQSTNGGTTWTVIPNVTGFLTVSGNPSMNGYRYRAVMTHDITGKRFVSSAAVLTVTTQQTSAPTATSPVNNQAVWTNMSSTFQLTSAASGEPTPTAQWQRSADNGSTWANVSGATSATQTFTVSTEFGQRSGPSATNVYRCIWTNSAGTATSRSYYVTNDWEA